MTTDGIQSLFERAPDMAYAYRIPGCGCIIACITDRPELAREVAKFKRGKGYEGFVLAHLPVEDVRSMPWGWPCEHMKAGGNVA